MTNRTTVLARCTKVLDQRCKTNAYTGTTLTPGTVTDDTRVKEGSERVNGLSMDVSS